MPVVSAGELQHTRAVRVRACQPERRHRGLGPRRDEPHLLDRGHRVGYLGGELDLPLRRGPEARPGEGGFPYRLDGQRVGVAEDERPPGLHPVE